MYLVEVIRAFDATNFWASVRFIARTEGESDTIPYLAQSVRENSVSRPPGNGIYCANIVSRRDTTTNEVTQNIECSTMEPQQAVTLFGFSFAPFVPKLAKSDATKGNGTGQNAISEKAVRDAARIERLKKATSTPAETQAEAKKAALASVGVSA